MITAVFTDYEYAYATGLWQWDYGQVLRVQGLLLPPAVEVHFSLQETGGEAVSRIGITRDGVMDVPIPDSMLGREVSKDYYIYAFIYQNDEISGETTHKIKIRTKARPKPQAFHTPEEGELFRKAIAAVNEAAGRAETAADRAGKTAEAVAPEIGENGNWMILGKDTGKPSRGKDGFPGKDGETGPPGPQGTPGKNGMSGEPGKSAYEYALDGGYAGTEEEFAERMAAEYATKSYIDSFSSRDINTPLWEITVEEPVAAVFLDTLNGQPFELREAFIKVDIPVVTEAVGRICVNFTENSVRGLAMTEAIANGKEAHAAYVLKKSYGRWILQGSYNRNKVSWLTGFAGTSGNDNLYFASSPTTGMSAEKYITRLNINAETGLIPAGTKITIYGLEVYHGESI